MINGIAHLAFQVSNMDASIKFYESAFGFKEKFRLNDEKGNPWIVYLQITHIQFIELFYSHDKIIQSQNKSSYQHLCLEVTGIKKIANELEKKGFKLDKPVTMGLDNNYQCWISDPDGNPIELMEYGIEALQLQI